MVHIKQNNCAIKREPQYRNKQQLNEETIMSISSI